jgi:pimeloyl-ACP methyl ester carboxylesterase
MPTTTVNGIELCYDTFDLPGGPDDGEPLVLINGLGSQMIRWPQGFIELLVDAGFRVIVHDNRDVGLSQKFADVTESPAYSVNDMAADTAGLLEHLGIDAAHIAGMSMGGMIGQVLAIRHADRVRSLASIMSAMGDDPVLSTDSEAVKIFAEPPETERDKAIEQDVRHRRLISGPGFAFDEDAARDLATRCFDRCYDPSGRRRQMLAVTSSGGRKAALSELKIPTVVIHGTQDPLVPVENGRKMADVVPGAELVEIEGMGHDLPAGAWPIVADAIASNARRTTTVS